MFFHSHEWYTTFQYEYNLKANKKKYEEGKTKNKGRKHTRNWAAQQGARGKRYIINLESNNY